VWGGDASDTAPGGRAGSVPGNCLDKSSVARAVSSARPQIPRGVQLQCLGRKGFQPTIARAAGAQTPTPAGCDGVDLTQIPGVNVLNAQTLLAEIGPNLSRFADAPTFTSWRTTGNGLVSMPELRWAMGEIWAQLGRKIPLFPAQIRSSRSVRPTDST
jgi:hypothetical protein